jgi:hypothetical protein
MVPRSELDILWESEEAEYPYRGGDDRVDDEQPLRNVRTNNTRLSTTTGVTDRRTLQPDRPRRQFRVD